RRVDFSDHAAEIERQVGFELARELLHALVFGKAMHLQPLDAAVARGEERALEERRADPVALPRLLDAEGGFRLARQWSADAPQLGCAAQNAVDEESMQHDARAARGLRVARDRLVRHRAGK